MENLLTAIKIADFIAKYADRPEVIILAIIICIVLYFICALVGR